MRAVIDRCSDAVPEAPGALYLRPILFGTTANIGAAATPTVEASLIVLASPVWDYFSGGPDVIRTDSNGDYAFQTLGPKIINSTATSQSNPPVVSEQEIDVQFGTGWQGVRYPFTPVVVFPEQPGGGGETFSSGVQRQNIRMLATGFGSYQKALPAGCTNDPDVQSFLSKRVRIDGQTCEIGAAPAMDRRRKHDIEVIVDRITIRKDARARLADSIETALSLGRVARDGRRGWT